MNCGDYIEQEVKCLLNLTILVPTGCFLKGDDDFRIVQFALVVDSMSEKDYILEQKALIDKLEATDERISEIDAEAAASTSMTDEEFLAKASYFLLSQELQGKRNIDYVKFITSADPLILKDFIKNVTTNFCIKNGRVISILFKNGIEIKFFYKPYMGDESPETA